MTHETLLWIVGGFVVGNLLARLVGWWRKPRDGVDPLTRAIDIVAADVGAMPRVVPLAKPKPGTGEPCPQCGLKRRGSHYNGDHPNFCHGCGFAYASNVAMTVWWRERQEAARQKAAALKAMREAEPPVVVTYPPGGDAEDAAAALKAMSAGGAVMIPFTTIDMGGREPGPGLSH